jgi:hypothetical protein
VRAQVVAEMQKTETKNSKAKDVFEKVKTDIRLMKEELNLIDRYGKTLQMACVITRVACSALFSVRIRIQHFMSSRIRIQHLMTKN